MARAPEAKTVLFLQGPPHIFARCVADQLERLGHRTLRINFCAGDWLSWHDNRATSYRGSLDDWPKWLTAFCRDKGVTDIVYYADRLPYHSAALDVGLDLGLRCTTYEFGYLRPDWITVERNGMSAHSLFPQDPDIIRKEASALPAPDRRPLYPFDWGIEAFHEVTFNMANVVFALAYPKYQRDKLYHPLIDYLSNIPRLAMSRSRNRTAEHLIDDVISVGLPYYVFPLQLQSDYQLRYNSQYEHIADAAEEVIASFARSAPASARLVFKVHPLDNGMEPWRKILRLLGQKHGVKKRIYVIDGGNLDRLLRHASGALTINSTTGIHALRVACPTKVLGIALYDIPGLTCQKPLDEFWRAATPPDLDLVEDLERLLAATIQVKGCFYTPEGRLAGAEAMARRIADGTVNGPFTAPRSAPRLARARSHGITVTFEEQQARRGKRELWTKAWNG
ncbi:capsule biosynthesis protein [Roseibium aquae]|nr:capsular biosynthesis protein [Roseibium aquae]